MKHNNQTTEQELLQAKQAAEDAKNKQNEAQGQLNSKLQQIKQRFGCTTIQAARDEVDRLKQRHQEYHDARVNNIQRLKTQYPGLWQQQK